MDPGLRSLALPWHKLKLRGSSPCKADKLYIGGAKRGQVTLIHKVKVCLIRENIMSELDQMKGNCLALKWMGCSDCCAWNPLSVMLTLAGTSFLSRTFNVSPMLRYSAGDRWLSGVM